MTDEEILEIGMQAGMNQEIMLLGRNFKLLKQFAKLVAEKEREACASLCNEHADDGSEGDWDPCCEYLANKIRDREQENDGMAQKRRGA